MSQDHVCFVFFLSLKNKQASKQKSIVKSSSFLTLGVCYKNNNNKTQILGAATTQSVKRLPRKHKGLSLTPRLDVNKALGVLACVYNPCAVDPGLAGHPVQPPGQIPSFPWRTLPQTVEMDNVSWGLTPTVELQPPYVCTCICTHSSVSLG